MKLNLLPTAAALRGHLMSGLLVGALAVAGATWAPPALAAPGAHGPNGEHLDAPTGAGAIGVALPRLETHSDLFELVAEWQDGQLRIYVDRYLTNEPVSQATLEVETGGLMAAAQYQADAGYYLVNAADMVAALAQPGEHALVFTLLAGTDADLLNGVLDTRTAVAGQGGHDHSHALEYTAYGVGAVLVAAGVWWVIRRRTPRAQQGVQA